MIRQHLCASSRSGLTFLELLLAISISGLILSAAAQLMFSFAQFWQQSEQEPRFVHHMDGVVSFIQYCLDQSEPLSDTAERRFEWSRPPGETAPAIHVRLESALPFFVTEAVTDPQVDAWLVFDEEKGLSLLWHIPRTYTRRRLKLLQTPLSPWVEDLEIGYFDADRNLWEYESYAQEESDEQRRPPEALRLVFNRNGKRAVRDLRLRRYDRYVLVY